MGRGGGWSPVCGGGAWDKGLWGTRDQTEDEWGKGTGPFARIHSLVPCSPWGQIEGVGKTKIKRQINRIGVQPSAPPEVGQAGAGGLCRRQDHCCHHRHPGSQLFCHSLDCNSCLLCHGRQHRNQDLLSTVILLLNLLAKVSLRQTKVLSHLPAILEQ